MFRPALVLVAVLSAGWPPFLHAADRCPWLTLGSAASVLGGPVTASIQVAEDGEKGICRFISSGEAHPASLEIFVEQPAPVNCPAQSPAVKAIGTEAHRCTLLNWKLGAEMIQGKVRETNFAVILVVSRRDRSSNTRDPLHDVAEQVAGNLF